MDYILKNYWNDKKIGMIKFNDLKKGDKIYIVNEGKDFGLKIETQYVESVEKNDTCIYFKFFDGNVLKAPFEIENLDALGFCFTNLEKAQKYFLEKESKLHEELNNKATECINEYNNCQKIINNISKEADNIKTLLSLNNSTPKKIGIHSTKTLYGWDENSIQKGGIGGSELWAIMISDEFAKKGYDVYLFGNAVKRHVSNLGVRYFQSDDYYSVSECVDFDYFIFSRYFPDNIENVRCNNIYIMAHDLQIEGLPYYYNDTLKKIKTIFVLSDFQKKQIIKGSNYLTDKYFTYTRNGVNCSSYEMYNNLPKKNQMVCCSGNYRQAMFIATYLFPAIKERVPDFELLLCHYFDEFDEDIYKQEGIKVIGTGSNPITKENLVKAQCESKIWIYVNTYTSWGDYYFNETFCISALEAACAKSAIIVGERTPFTETLCGYNYFVGKELYPDDILEQMPNENKQKFYDLLIEESIKCLTDEDYRQKLVEETYKIGVKSTWKDACEGIENKMLN